MPSIAAFIFITLPWLNPFAFGPTPAVAPLLFSWVCAALVMLAWPNSRQQWAGDAMVRAVALAWLVAALISAWLGLLQYFGATGWLGKWVNHTGMGEAFGNLRQRNQFASLMNIGLAALLWWVSPSAAGRLPGASVLAMAVLIGAGNAASSSRTGLFQLLVVAGLTWMWQRRAAPSQTRNAVWSVLWGVTLGYAIATVALPWLAGIDLGASGALARLRAGDAVCASRLTLWSNVLHLIAQRPWLGWGWGELDYAHFITLYPGERFCDILDNAHNLPLHLAVELGVPVALMVCGVALWLVWRAKPWSEVDATRQMAWAILAVMVLHSLLEYPLWYGPFQMAFGLCGLLLWRQNHITNKPLAPYWKALAALLLIAYCAYASWQYFRAAQIYLAPEQRDAAYSENTMEKIRGVHLYQDQVRFAELTTAELAPDNALYINALAKDMLHFSPEARVVEMVIDSALLLGRVPESQFYQARFQAAFPQAYAAWLGARK
jgi:O-antigen ligase